MKAALYYRPGEARYEEIPTPKAGPGELVVKIGTALTCGTDLKTLRRGHPVLIKSTPAGFGHEFSGTVVEVGSGVKPFEVGDRIVAANSAPCYQCYLCLKGNYNLCESLEFLNGAYAEYLTIPAQITARNTYLIPDHVPFEVAAFTEPLAVCLRGIELSGVSAGDRVAIIGLGTIGQLLTKLAKWKGAHVTAFARSSFKRSVAEHFGQADTVLPLEGDWSPELFRQEHTPRGYGFDVVFEAVGLPELWEKAIYLARPGGRVNLFAGCPGGSKVPLDTRWIHYHEITLLSHFHHTPFFVKKALDLLIQQMIDPRPLITGHRPMHEFLEALTEVEQGTALKIALIPTL